VHASSVRLLLLQILHCVRQQLRRQWRLRRNLRGQRAQTSLELAALKGGEQT
jgi:hypothetical protein